VKKLALDVCAQGLLGKKA